MEKSKAFWLLSDIEKRFNLTAEEREAIHTAQELLESEDLLSEMIEKGELSKNPSKEEASSKKLLHAFSGGAYVE